MYKEKILSSINYTKSNIESLIKNIKDKEHFEYNYTNWRASDIINHIAAWLIYSSENFRYFKTNGKVKEDGSDFVLSFNLENYKKTSSYTLDKSLENIEHSFSHFKETLSLYSEEELSPDYHLDMFPLSLWQCVMIDIVIHPALHFMYEYLKNAMYDSFIENAVSSEEYFSYCSNGYFSAYSFSEFSKDKNEIKNYMNELKKYSQDKKNISLINKITEINM